MTGTPEAALNLAGRDDADPRVRAVPERAFYRLPAGKNALNCTNMMAATGLAREGRHDVGGGTSCRTRARMRACAVGSPVRPGAGRGWRSEVLVQDL